VATRRKAKVQPEWHWYVMLACIFFEYVRPQDYFLPFLQPLRLPGILTLVATFIFFTNDKKYVLQERVFVLMLVFMFVCAETIVCLQQDNNLVLDLCSLCFSAVCGCYKLRALPIFLQVLDLPADNAGDSGGDERRHRTGQLPVG